MKRSEINAAIKWSINSLTRIILNYLDLHIGQWMSGKKTRIKLIL